MHQRAMCDLNAVILVKNPIHTFEKYWGLFVLQHNWKEKGDFFCFQDEIMILESSTKKLLM